MCFPVSSLDQGRQLRYQFLIVFKNDATVHAANDAGWTYQLLPTNTQPRLYCMFAEKAGVIGLVP